MGDLVTIDTRDGVADVRLNRPDKINALSPEMFRAISEASEQLAGERSLRAVVLSGNGRGFCSGLDFQSFQAMTGDRDASDRASSVLRPREERPDNPAQRVAYGWKTLPVPVIAAVHGHALGGGLQIALGADIRISHPDTKWSVREVHWGLVPDMTGTFMLTRVVRPDIARELTYTARMVDGREAYEMGLVTHLSEEPYEDAMVLAREIAGRSPGAVRGSKALFNRMFTEGAAEQFAAERQVIGEQIGSPNQVEAIMSNMEQRAPNFAD